VRDGFRLVHAEREPRQIDDRLPMRADQEFLDAVEELRQLQTPIPTKADVIREAVMEALKRAKVKGGSGESKPCAYAAASDATNAMTPAIQANANPRLNQRMSKRPAVTLV
jgi:hypothetical protein